MARAQERRAGVTEVFIRPGREQELAVAVDIDDDAWAMFGELDRRFAIELGDDHPFVRAERARWAAAACAGGLCFACAPDGTPVGFAVLDTIDGAPHLEQVSVNRAWGGHGIGRMLVEHALRWSARAGELWITTYDHVAWNLPWYQRLGFVVVPDADCGAEVRAALERERHVLPDPDHRVAMVHQSCRVPLKPAGPTCR
jgi:GNAT superfamily N-acetyltransferase